MRVPVSVLVGIVTTVGQLSHLLSDHSLSNLSFGSAWKRTI